MENKNKKCAYRGAAVNSNPPPNFCFEIRCRGRSGGSKRRKKEEVSAAAEQTASLYFSPQTGSQSVGEGAGLRPALPPPPPPLCGVSHQPLRRSELAATNCREFVCLFVYPSCLRSQQRGGGVCGEKGRGLAGGRRSLCGRVITCTPRPRCSEWATPRTDSCRCPRSLKTWTPSCWTLLSPSSLASSCVCRWRRPPTSASCSTS